MPVGVRSSCNIIMRCGKIQITRQIICIFNYSAETAGMVDTVAENYQKRESHNDGLHKIRT